MQTCPVIKYKSVRCLSAARLGFPVFKYTKFTSTGDRPAFKRSSTGALRVNFCTDAAGTPDPAFPPSGNRAQEPVKVGFRALEPSTRKHSFLGISLRVVGRINPLKWVSNRLISTNERAPLAAVDPDMGRRVYLEAVTGVSRTILFMGTSSVPARFEPQS